MHRARSISPLAFVAFPLAVLFLFTLLPTAIGLALSLFQWDGGAAPAWIGLRNYSALLNDHRFGPALRNTLIFVIASVPPTVVVAFLLAVTVHARWFRAKAVVRTMLFMPTIVSVVAVGFVWRWVLDDNAGLLNWLLAPLLEALGLTSPNWLNEGSWPMVWVIIISIWRQVGFCLVLYLAALASVNEHLYESAEIDGASRWRTLLHVTWPQVAPMTVFLIVTGVISALQVFDLIYVLSGQQVGTNLTVLNYEVYNQFRAGQLGYAAAIGAVIFVITAIATSVQFGVLGKGRARFRGPRRNAPGEAASA